MLFKSPRKGHQVRRAHLLLLVHPLARPRSSWQGVVASISAPSQVPKLASLTRPILTKRWRGLSGPVEPSPAPAHCSSPSSSPEVPLRLWRKLRPTDPTGVPPALESQHLSSSSREEPKATLIESSPEAQDHRCPQVLPSPSYPVLPPSPPSSKDSSSHEVSPLPSPTPSQTAALLYISFTVSASEVEVTTVKASKSPTLIPKGPQVPISRASDSPRADPISLAPSLTGLPSRSFLPPPPSLNHRTPHRSFLSFGVEGGPGSSSLMPPKRILLFLLQVQSPKELWFLNQAELQPSLEHLRHDLTLVSSLTGLLLLSLLLCP